MAKVVVTGLGLITSIGNDHETVIRNLRDLRHGFELYAPFQKPGIPVKVLGTVKGFAAESTDPEDWTYPSEYRVRREILRGLSPHGLYAYCAMTQAIQDAGLTESDVSNEDTGIYTASAGSVFLLRHHLNHMYNAGVNRVSPLGIVASIAGTLSFNLVAAFRIIGASCGFVSACASSGHALGFAYDEIKTGRQKRMFVVGAEDGNLDAILPFASMRALSSSADPDNASKPFDAKRNGFVGTGGAVVMILEEEETARARGAKIYGEMVGWSQASDGHNVAISHPEGVGLEKAMRRLLQQQQIQPEQVDYINAHATSTQIGDLSEIKALQSVFGGLGEKGPAISSTKALSGHGLSLASVMEAAFSLLSMKAGFTPGSAGIRELDPACEGLRIIQKTVEKKPKLILSNSSGFGGANVSLLFRDME
jgi:3-oxoacyl-[acyl-carrier-protein] synthase-1